MLLSTSSSDDRLGIEEVSPASSTLTHSLFSKESAYPGAFFSFVRNQPTILLRKTVEFF